MEEPKAHDEEVKLPDEQVEDLEPSDEESSDVSGGLTLKRGTGDMKYSP